MRLMVCLHHLILGGSPLNALDLALKMRSLGHDVGIFSIYKDKPGPVYDLTKEAGLPIWVVEYGWEDQRKAMPFRPTVVKALMAAVKEHRTELIHAYESPFMLDAFHGPHLRWGIPIASTVYAMNVPKWIPRYGELVVGSQEILEQTNGFHDTPGVLIEPPVNTDSDNPDLIDGASFRAEHGIRPDEIAVVIVSRLEPDIKAEGILRTIEAFEIGDDPRLRFVIVGTGPTHQEIADRARRANAMLGREAIILTGSMTDPRPAYAAADIAMGMGGSALRAMSFGKPLIVHGIQGFSRPFNPQTYDDFMHTGFWGIGDGDMDPKPLVREIQLLADDPDLRARLGAYARQVVLERFSLDAAAAKLEEVYARAMADPIGLRRRIAEAVRAASHRAASEILPDQVKDRLRRRTAEDR
jgi:glycosyltransferase involved in cell wall biosynthesis